MGEFKVSEAEISFIVRKINKRDEKTYRELGKSLQGLLFEKNWENLM